MSRTNETRTYISRALALLWAIAVCCVAAPSGAAPAAQSDKDAKKREQSDAERKKQMTRTMDQVFMVLNTIMTTPGLSEGERRERALDFLKTFRYGDESRGYLVVVDLQGVVLVEPNITELVGKDLHSLEDPNGMRVFREFTRICLEEGQGWTTYVWPKEGNKEWHVPTVSLVRYFEPLNFAVAASYHPVTIRVDDPGTPNIDDEQPASAT